MKVPRATTARKAGSNRSALHDARIKAETIEAAPLPRDLSCSPRSEAVSAELKRPRSFLRHAGGVRRAADMRRAVCDQRTDKESAVGFETIVYETRDGVAEIRFNR